MNVTLPPPDAAVIAIARFDGGLQLTLEGAPQEEIRTHRMQLLLFGTDNAGIQRFDHCFVGLNWIHDQNMTIV